MDGVSTELKSQGKAVLVMVGIAIVAVLAISILEILRPIAEGVLPNNNASKPFNVTMQATVTAFVAAFALLGTFATLTMLVVVIKVIIGVVKGLR